jgi:MFS family permease
MFSLILNRNFKTFLMHVTLRDIAKSLFSVFIPIFLLANNVPLLTVGIYFLIQEIITMLFTIFLFYWVQRWGIKKIAYIGILFQIFAVILLYFISTDYWVIGLLAFTRGVSHAFYWGVYDTFLVHISENDSGKDLGIFYLFTGIFGALIIPFSGFILETYSSLLLIISSVFLELIALYFLYKVKLNPLRGNNQYSSIRNMLKRKENRYIFKARGLIEFCENTTSTILPIFIYLIYESLFISGLFLMGASIVSGLYSYYLGTKGRLFKNFYIVYINILFFLLLLLLVYFFPNPLMLVVATIGLPLFKRGLYLSIISGVNNSCKSDNCYNKFLFSRIGENISSIFIALVVIVFSAHFKWSFLASIFLISVSSIMIIQYKKFINSW